MNPEKFWKLFPLGSHLCREPMPARPELKRDLARLKKNGFNLVKLQEHWALDEAREGHYDFSRCQELIEAAGRLDLGVYLGLTCEQAPNWLWEKYPDCRVVDRTGQPVRYQAQATLPNDGQPGPCYDHPGARADQERFIGRLVSTLGRYENLVVWNAWQEIYQGQAPEICFCPHTLSAFQAWLRTEYRDLDRLNRAWRARYADWKWILPDLGRKTCLPVNIEWNRFFYNVRIPSILAGRARTIRRHDPLKRPVFAHKSRVELGAVNDRSAAEALDFLGSSIYPAWTNFHPWDDGAPAAGRRVGRHQALLAEAWDAALRIDHVRSSNRPGRPVWAAELQGGPVSTHLHLSRTPEPADLRRWMLSLVGAGATGLSFWVTRAEIMAAEGNGFGLLDSTGGSSTRFEEAGRIGRALNRYPELFGRPSRPAAEIAILASDENFRVCQELEDGLEHLRYSLRGWHRRLWENGRPADFLTVEQLRSEPGRAYQIVIFPFPLAVSEATARVLADYVAGGGRLLCEAAAGRLDRYGYCNRGELSPALAELFGVRSRRFAMVREPEDGGRWSPVERSWGDYLEAAWLTGCGPLAGRRLRASFYLQTFECLEGRPILRYDKETAGAARKHGRGEAWLIGTFAGHSAIAYRDPASEAAGLAILEKLGGITGRTGRLLHQRRVGQEREAWLFFNTGEKSRTETIPLNGWRRAEDLLGQPLLREGNRIRLTVAGLDSRVIVVSGRA